jgi:hypothetical protein
MFAYLVEIDLVWIAYWFVRYVFRCVRYVCLYVFYGLDLRLFVWNDGKMNFSLSMSECLDE